SRNNVVLVSDLSTGKISSHDPHYGPRKPDMRGVPTSRRGNPQDVIAPRGFRGGCEVLDMRAFANIPWKPGRFAATVVVYDWPTNTVVVELQSKGVGPGPEADALRIPHAQAMDLALQQERIARSPSPMYAFGATPRTPALAGPGLALVVPAAISSKAAAWMVEGAARLELLPGNLVAPPVTGDAPAPNRPPAPAAFVSIGLLVATLDAGMRQIDVQVPVASGSPLTVGHTIDVAFRVDLKSALRAELAPGEYQIYDAGTP